MLANHVAVVVSELKILYINQLTKNLQSFSQGFKDNPWQNAQGNFDSTKRPVLASFTTNPTRESCDDGPDITGQIQKPRLCLVAQPQPRSFEGVFKIIIAKY